MSWFVKLINFVSVGKKIPNFAFPSYLRKYLLGCYEREENRGFMRQSEFGGVMSPSPPTGLAETRGDMWKVGAATHST